MLQRLARTAFRRRWTVLLVWIGALVGLNVLANGIVGSDFRTDFNLPDTESKEVQDLLEARSPTRAGFTGQIVFQAQQGIDDPAVRQAMEGLFAEVDELDGVDVTSPYSPEGAGQVSQRAPIAFAELQVEDRSQSEFLTLSDEIQDLGDEVDVDGLAIEYGGDIFAEFELPESEILGLLAAVIILIVAFGSVVAMGLPIGTALFGLGTGTALVVLGSNLLSMPDFSTQMAAMIGLGVGIDYALFIVTRYREGLHVGLDPETATVEAVDTSGRAVLFAGTTVIISLFGLYLMGLSFVNGLATAGVLAVLTMMVAAVTLLPALIGFVGERIEETSYRGVIGVVAVTLGVLLAVLFGAPAFAVAGVLILAGVVIASLTFAKRLAHRLPHRRQRSREETGWYRWSRFIQRNPWPALIGGVAVLVLLALPLLSIRLGFGDTGNLPERQTPRRAYDMLAEGFGPGFNGPLIIAVPGEVAGDTAALASLSETLRGTESVAFATDPIPVADDVALVQVYPTTAPQDEETSQLVHRLRDEVIPASSAPGALVGGFTAAGVDFSDYLGDRLPWLIGVVLLLSFLLLMTVFRSLLVPLKAVVLNLLSIGAAYGVVVAVFQWGWGKDLIGVGREGPVEAWAPMMLFAIVFGLSMDYEVFLLSRIKEEYDRTHDNKTAVADGLAVTARVITAAALIMVCVFSAFVLGDERSIKLFGLGLAVAVLIDATIVRLLLVPATMELLGDRNWWLPKWLDRILPRINVEGRAHTSAAGALPDEAAEEELVGAGRE
jgi:putative drug exporter of the RND superfamily